MSNKVDSWLPCLLKLVSFMLSIHFSRVSRSMEKMIVVTIEVKKVVGKAVGQGLYWNEDLHKVEPSTVQIW